MSSIPVAFGDWRGVGCRGGNFAKFIASVKILRQSAGAERSVYPLLSCLTRTLMGLQGFQGCQELFCFMVNLL